MQNIHKNECIIHPYYPDNTCTIELLNEYSISNIVFDYIPDFIN